MCSDGSSAVRSESPILQLQATQRPSRLLFPSLHAISQRTVGIFPASGGIGGGTVKHILNRLPAKSLTFIARSPEKLQEQRLSGATVRKADYDDTASLEHAFDGIDTLFLISYASVEHHHRSEVCSNSSHITKHIQPNPNSDTASPSTAPSKAANHKSHCKSLKIQKKPGKNNCPAIRCEQIQQFRPS